MGMIGPKLVSADQLVQGKTFHNKNYTFDIVDVTTDKIYFKFRHWSPEEPASSWYIKEFIRDLQVSSSPYYEVILIAEEDLWE